MPGYFVFVRFFLGYFRPFPLDDFMDLEDEKIQQALRELAVTWLASPEGRKRFPDQSERPWHGGVPETDKMCQCRAFCTL